jgi:pimeloyl-ACP methyl ester carboxylesterase
MSPLGVAKNRYLPSHFMVCALTHAIAARYRFGAWQRREIQLVYKPVEVVLYFKRNLWAEQGLSDARIAEYLAFFRRQDTPASYEAYLDWYRKNAPETYGDPMDQRRWGFEQLLVNANARAALRKTTVPVLAIWGSYDLHVDPQKNRAIYEEELTRAGNPDFTLKVFQGANHSLIAMNERRLAISGFPRWWNTAKFILLGRDAFAEGYFDLLTSWLEKRA